MDSPSFDQYVVWVAVENPVAEDHLCSIASSRFFVVQTSISHLLHIKEPSERDGLNQPSKWLSGLISSIHQIPAIPHSPAAVT